MNEEKNRDPQDNHVIEHVRQIDSLCFQIKHNNKLVIY
jgi:hypothetical protein